MAKKRAKNTCVLVVSGMTLNGRPLPDLDYQRTEYDDGSVVETGRPPGVPAGATLGEMFRAAAGLPPEAGVEQDRPPSGQVDPAGPRRGRKGVRRAQG